MNYDRLQSTSRRLIRKNQQRGRFVLIRAGASQRNPETGYSEQGSITRTSIDAVSCGINVAKLNNTTIKTGDIMLSVSPDYPIQINDAIQDTSSNCIYTVIDFQPCQPGGTLLSTKVLIRR